MALIAPLAEGGVWLLLQHPHVAGAVRALVAHSTSQVQLDYNGDVRSRTVNGGHREVVQHLTSNPFPLIESGDVSASDLPLRAVIF